MHASLGRPAVMDATYIPWQVEENDFRDCAEIVRNAGGVCTDEKERTLLCSKHPSGKQEKEGSMTRLAKKRNKILATSNMLQLPTSSQSAVVVVSRHAEQQQQQDLG